MVCAVEIRSTKTLLEDATPNVFQQSVKLAKTVQQSQVILLIYWISAEAILRHFRKSSLTLFVATFEV